MNKPCAVYLIQSHAPIWPPHAPRDGNFVFKVGISVNPSGRLDTLRTASPAPLDLMSVWWLPSRDVAMRVEKTFLDYNGPWRLGGEWFYTSSVGASQEIDGLICSHAANEMGLSRSEIVSFLISCGMTEEYAQDVIMSQYGEEADA